jgi:putative transposase
MSRPPRLPGFDYLGRYRYFLTFCTFERRKAFSDPKTATCVLTPFRRTAQTSAFVILAYCIMPDHVHLLVEGTTSSADFTRFVKRLKQSSGQIYSRSTKQRLWQEGYYDRVLRPTDDAKLVARYIVANPVRAGLVRGLAEYPHIGSDVWSVDELIDSIL